MKRIAVLGAGGQVGRALVALLGQTALPVTREQADLDRPESLSAALDVLKPDVVINAAAYTQVDAAENNVEQAFRINAKSPAILAHWCAEHRVPFVHYSTDYVFDGSGTVPWREADITEPLNRYGASKLEGERGVASSGGQWLIFRTSWVYDATGKNFLNTMLRLGAEREHLTVINDQHGAPCYAPHLARLTLECLKKAVIMSTFPSGIYHATHRGETTWYGFAKTIFEEAAKKKLPLKVKTVEPISSSAYPTLAQRPLNSRLDMSKLEKVFSIHMPDWQEGLREAMENTYAGH